MLNEPTASSFHISIPIPIHGSIHRATWLPPPPPYQSVSLHDCHVVHEAFLAFGVWLSSASAPAAVCSRACLSLSHFVGHPLSCAPLTLRQGCLWRGTLAPQGPLQQRPQNPAAQSRRMLMGVRASAGTAGSVAMCWRHQCKHVYRTVWITVMEHFWLLGFCITRLAPCELLAASD